MREANYFKMALSFELCCDCEEFCTALCQKGHTGSGTDIVYVAVVVVYHPPVCVYLSCLCVFGFGQLLFFILPMYGIF